MNSYNLINPKRDIVFKRIFGKKGNEGILKDFLESILEIEIDSLSLDINTELVPDFAESKVAKVDVLTKLSDGTLVDIEIQMDSNKFSEKRCLKYWSDLYNSSIKKGQDYKNLKKTIGIWILNGMAYPHIEKYNPKFKMFECDLKIPAFDDIEMHVIELAKLRKLDIIKPSKKEFWLWFIDHTNRELVEMSCVDNEKIREAREQLDRIRADDELMYALINQEIAEMDYRVGMREAEEKGIAEGRAEGRKEGIEKGKVEEKLEIARKLKKTGMPISQIVEITELTEEEIDKL